MTSHQNVSELTAHARELSYGGVGIPEGIDPTVITDSVMKADWYKIWGRYRIGHDMANKIPVFKSKLHKELCASNPKADKKILNEVALSVAWQIVNVEAMGIITNANKLNTTERRELIKFKTNAKLNENELLAKRARKIVELEEQLKAAKEQVKKVRSELKNRPVNNDSARKPPAATRKLKIELDSSLPLPVAFALSHLHLIPDHTNPDTWGIKPAAAPDATCWNTLMLAAMAKEKFADSVISEMVRVKQASETFDRDMKKRELDAKLKRENELHAMKLKAMLADGDLNNGEESKDAGIEELDNILDQ